MKPPFYVAQADYWLCQKLL